MALGQFALLIAWLLLLALGIAEITVRTVTFWGLIAVTGVLVWSLAMDWVIDNYSGRRLVKGRIAICFVVMMVLRAAPLLLFLRQPGESVFACVILLCGLAGALVMERS